MGGKRKVWSPLDEATIRALFPSLGSVEVGKRLGRPAIDIAKKANKMGLYREFKQRMPDELDVRLLELARRPNGVSTTEVDGVPLKASGKVVARLCDAGKLFRGKLGHKTVRYFATAEAAEAYVKQHLAPTPYRIPGSAAPKGERYTPEWKGGNRKAWWSPDAEPHKPMNPDGSPAYTHIVVKMPPPKLLRTNTHSPY